ncbi:DEAD/DEAH box helicase, partial [Myxococcota bacterium]|nr:DEAD/DEAH box helicase [Myxococcota bacterium]
MSHSLHPLVARWFEARFGAPTRPQRDGWPSIFAGHDTLIAAPTGSGKTLAAFLASLDRLIRLALTGRLEDHTHVVYVSPLKALSNDVSRNLEGPLTELRALAASEGHELPPIRVAVRTGDTPASERAKMAKLAPHILVTTPESLYILLTSARAREGLGRVDTVIVDEIHALAPDKRGAHLALSLERLDALVEATGARAPVRIGLSATQRPIERVARFLGGARRTPTIVDAGFGRELDLAIEIPDEPLGAITSLEQIDRVLDRIASLVEAHRTTIVFVNTRRLVERFSHQLAARLGEERVAAHHGSLSRALRLSAERRLERAEVRCVVATASLELGIDVGAVELVVQVGSPRSIATLLQRVGRSGHSLGATPKGRLFALTRDQLVECAALVRAVRAGELDELVIPAGALDVLAQQLVATVATDDWNERALFELVRRAHPYEALTEADWEAVLELVAEGITTERGRARAYVHRDRIHGRLHARKGARLVAITSGGAIPDNADYAVVAEPDEANVGTLHEDFAIDSRAGDVFLLGNTSWRIRRVEAGRVRVEDAGGAPPTIPFWFGEAPARTFELSREVSRLRGEVDDALARGTTHDALARALAPTASMPIEAAIELVEYLAAAREVLGVVPTAETLVAERFFDEGGGMQLVLHSPLGGRINRAWGLALRKRFCRSFDFELQAAATDDGITISLGPMHSFPLETVFDFLTPSTVGPLLEQAVLAAPVFAVRWRWNAQRALAVPRHARGKKVPPPILRMRTDDLLSSVFPQSTACLENVTGDIEIPDHPLVRETMKDCLEEAMDLPGLVRVLEAIRDGRVRTVARDTAEPSLLSHELLNANPYAFLDDAPLEERRARAVSLRRRGGAPKTTDALGLLDAEVITVVEAEAEPAPRDADELHDLLLSMMLLPEPRDGEGAAVGTTRAAWAPWFDALAAARRVTRASWRDAR